MTAPAQSRPTDLGVVFGFAGATPLTVGITMGAGIFRKPPPSAGSFRNPLAAIILGAFLLGHGSLSNITEAGAVQRGGLARAVASVIWAYDGWIAVSMIAGEVVAPERLMKRIIITGMLVIVTLYVGANIAYLYMMPVGIMAQQKEAIARTVMTAIAGPAGGVLIMLAIMTR